MDGKLTVADAGPQGATIVASALASSTAGLVAVDEARPELTAPC